MTRPRTPAPDELPKELREAHAWCAWGKDGSKIPIGKDGKPADVQKANPGMTLLEALSLANTFGGGVGICLVGTPFAAVDGDSAFKEDGNAEDWASTVLAKSAGLYVETSPSGRGFHMIGLAPEGKDSTGRTNKRNPKAKKQGIETFIGQGYLTVTGLSELGPPDVLGSATAAIKAAGSVATAWGRDNGKSKGGQAPKVQPRLVDSIPGKLSAVLAADPNLNATWEGSRSDLKDKSASEYDLALASLLAARGFSWQLTWDAVVLGRQARGQDVSKALRADYAESTLTRAFSGSTDAEQRRPFGKALEDFWAYGPIGRYIHRPSGELWAGHTVNELIPKEVVGGGLSAHKWLLKNRHVDQMTWAPGLPEVIEGSYIREGGWIPFEGARVYNTYRPPLPLKGDAKKAAPWLKLLKKLFPEDWTDALNWMAHRAQHPEQKINHALVIGGSQGCGKDTVLYPLTHAVGTWNYIEISPGQIAGQFNGYVKSVILKINEAYDLGDIKKIGFYEHTKTLTASPPETIRVNEKHKPEQQVPNLCGVIITTNHHNGLHLPPEDRRHLVCWSVPTKEDFEEGYWSKIYEWYSKGGVGHVAALLREHDLTGFNAAEPPRKTNAFRGMVETGRSSEQNEFSDALEELDWPEAVTFNMVQEAAADESPIRLWQPSGANKWDVFNGFRDSGYVICANTDKEARWYVAGKRERVYTKTSLMEGEQRDSVRKMQAEAAVK